MGPPLPYTALNTEPPGRANPSYTHGLMPVYMGLTGFCAKASLAKRSVRVNPVAVATCPENSTSSSLEISTFLKPKCVHAPENP